MSPRWRAGRRHPWKQLVFGCLLGLMTLPLSLSEDPTLHQYRAIHPCPQVELETIQYVSYPGMTQAPTPVALVPLSILGSEDGALTAHSSAFNVALRPTGLFTTWPVGRTGRRCTNVLETSALAPADCPGAETCGNMIWHEIERNWYGKELGMCIGHSHSRIHVTPHGVFDVQGRRLNHWGEYHTFSDGGPLLDYHGIRPYLAMVRMPDRDIVFSKRIVTNVAGIGFNRSELINPKHMIDNAGRVCPSTYPQLDLDSIVFYDGPTLSHWPQSVPIVAPRNITHPTPNQCGELFLTDRRISYESIVHRISDRYGNIGKSETHMICMPHGYITSYAFPGHSWLRSALTAAAEIILDILFSLASTLGETVYMTYQSVNRQYRLFEGLLLFGVAIAYFDSPWRAGFALVAYYLLTGVARQ